MQAEELAYFPPGLVPLIAAYADPGTSRELIGYGTEQDA